ncbi:MAG: septum site-determining protein MinC [bacterium]|nr:septum site-determining protein MinC [bacterium]
MSQPVVIKSSKNAINLVLDSNISFDELLVCIKEKFVESERFFKDAKIALSFEGRELSQEEQFSIIETIQKNSSISILCILDHDELMDEVIQRRMNQYIEEQKEDSGYFYKGTLRSGQQIESETSMIILGDVNPGAKVIAKGNIIVLGSLKGIAYAGAAGDDTCIVAALEMDPVQIKIGDVIGRSADKKSPFKGIRKKNKDDYTNPMIAMVYDSQILIEPISKGVFRDVM